MWICDLDYYGKNMKSCVQRELGSQLLFWRQIWVPLRRWGGLGELRISWRSEGMREECRLVTEEKWVLGVDRGKKIKADEGRFFGSFHSWVSNVVIFCRVKCVWRIRSEKSRATFWNWNIGLRSNFVGFISLFHEVLYVPWEKSYARNAMQKYAIVAEGDLR